MKRSILLFAVLLGIASLGQAEEILRWERLPLSVRLLVGQERVIFVDRNVRVGMPASLGNRLRVQSAGGALYLKANAPIEVTRLQLQDAISGALILLDIVAEEAAVDIAPLEPARIVDGQAARAAQRIDGVLGEASARPAQAAPIAPATPIPVALTRYAAQSLYAPLRTVEPVPGLVRVATPRILSLETLLPTLPVSVKALVAWRLEDYWVTAVRITNNVQRWLVLDPRALQGNFLAATFQHADLGPARDSTDTTMLYLITRGHGLAEALLPSVGAIDAASNLPPAPDKGGDPREE
jgi:integrating conjugative element protein (TIGR03749 family)